MARTTSEPGQTIAGPARDVNHRPYGACAKLVNTKNSTLVYGVYDHARPHLCAGMVFEAAEDVLLHTN